LRVTVTYNQGDTWCFDLRKFDDLGTLQSW